VATLTPALTPALVSGLVPSLLRGSRLLLLGARLWRRLWLLLLLCLRLLRLGRACLVTLVLAAATAAPMPLRLPLVVGRDRPQFSLGLR
jgi:hypothetical protein